MTLSTENDTFLAVWNAEAENTLRLLEALPPDPYDYRTDPKGCLIGEQAYHLNGIDACLTFGIAEGRFSLEEESPNLKRPRALRYRHGACGVEIRKESLT